MPAETGDGNGSFPATRFYVDRVTRQRRRHHLHESVLQEAVSQPQYRLRVGEVRVFYDVTAKAVEVLAIVTKGEASRWLGEHGTPHAPGGPR